MTIIDAIQDEKLFARRFKSKATWEAWLAFIAAVFGVPMTPEQLATYEACTGSPDDVANSAAGWLVGVLTERSTYTLANL